jgi:hypothetical protein
MVNYDKLFGQELGVSVFPTNEKKSNDSCYVLYKFNTYSSLAYLYTSYYYLYYVNSLLKITSIGVVVAACLTVASVFWWACQRKSIQKIDITLYSALIIWFGFYCLCYLKPEYEELISCFYLVLVTVFGYFVCNDYLTARFVSIINAFSFFSSLCILFAIIIYREQYKIISPLIITVLGFLFKLIDTFNIVNINYLGSGTGWFHIFTAVGVTSMWKNLQ